MPRLRRKRLLTIEITVWDIGQTVKYRPGLPEGSWEAKQDAYITAVRKALMKGAS